MAAIGQVIDDKYEITKLIGQGGMSKVYLAMDKRLNKLWAIKEIQKRAKDKNNEVVVQSAIAEANLIKQLDHPAIVRIVDIIDNGNVIYIIEDFIEGETLSSVLEREGALSQKRVVDWGIQICKALEYLHTRKAPIVYRDMKPGNVMLKEESGKDVIKVIDFGIAREYKDQNLADTVCLGTKGYAAPEQFGGKGQTDARTDIYCLGVTLYHLLTGHNPAEPPYEIYPIRHWNPQLDQGLEAVIQKCTQYDPKNRFQSCAELIYALENYEKHGEDYRKQLKRKVKMFAVTAISAIFFTLIGIFGLVMRTQTNNADYNQNIARAEKATSVEEKIDYYKTAIDIKPLEQEAYLGMIDAFKDDASFSVDEETEFKKKINANLSRLREEETYANLAFETGKIYWYYYDYGKTDTADNQVTKMKSAIQWFEDAVKYGKDSDDFRVMATIYRDIGKFNRDITLNIEEASDKGMYAPYWENIKELVDIIEDGESEIIELEVYRLVMSSMENYTRKFKADDIEELDMLEMFEKVKEATEDVDTTSDKTEEIKADVIARFDAVQMAIENAYRE